MTSYNPTYGSWTATSIASTSITNGNTSTTSSAIDNSGKTSTQVSVTIAYGSTANSGCIVYVLQDVDGTNYETAGSNPMSVLMAYATSTTFYRVFALPSAYVAKFKVAVSNPSGGTVTASVSYRTCTTDGS